MQYRLAAVFGAVVLALAVAVPAYAFDCMVAKKPARAGAAIELDFSAGEEPEVVPLKNNPGDFDRLHGGFVSLTDGENSASTFAHAPDGVLPPVREGGSQHNCDGKGLDSIELCFPE
jgi:hypothetical protein